jgi:hypothetical protein
LFLDQTMWQEIGLVTKISNEWGNLEKVMKKFEGRHASGVRLGWGDSKIGGVYENALFITLDLKKVSSILGRIVPYKSAPPYLTQFLWLTNQYLSKEVPMRAFEKKGLKEPWPELSVSTKRHRAWLKKVGYNKHGNDSPLLRNSDSLFNTLSKGYWAQKREDDYQTVGGKYIRSFIEIKDASVPNESRHGQERTQNIAERFRHHTFGTVNMPARPMIPRNNADLTGEDYTHIKKLFRESLKEKEEEAAQNRISRMFTKLRGIFKRK